MQKGSRIIYSQMADLEKIASDVADTLGEGLPQHQDAVRAVVLMARAARKVAAGEANAAEKLAQEAVQKMLGAAEAVRLMRVG